MGAWASTGGRRTGKNKERIDGVGWQKQGSPKIMAPPPSYDPAEKKARGGRASALLCGVLCCCDFSHMASPDLESERLSHHRLNVT